MGVNTVVTNMPGPQFALYQCGAEMQVARPVVPLNGGLGIVIGVLSYNGTISFGISCDPAIMEDLGEFRAALETSFNALVKSVAKHHKPVTEKPKLAAVPRSAGRPKKKAAVKKAAGKATSRKTAPGKKAG